MAETREAILQCVSCGRRETVRDFDPARSYRCTACSELLMTPSQAGATVVRPGAEAAIPPEVQEALRDPRKRAGRFVLVRSAGGGGMGLVYKAWDPDLCRWVAVKLIRPEAAGEGDLARFKREARVAAGLDHPNIAPIFEVGDLEGQAFIVMKFIEGATLDRAGFATLHAAAQAVREACRGVAHAHQAGVIHRDIKPKNIMVDRAGHVYVMDFGLAKPLNLPGLTATEGSLGTPAYMSPEQARGRLREMDSRTDVFSLGVTLWELLAGRPARTAADLVEMILKVAQEPVPPLRAARPEAPEFLEAVLLRATAMNPAERYANAAELGDALEEALRRDGPAIEALPLLQETATRSPTTIPLARPPGRGSRVAGALALVALVAGGLTLIARSPQRPTPTPAPAGPEAILKSAQDLAARKKWRSAAAIFRGGPESAEAAAIVAEAVARGSRIAFVSLRTGNEEVWTIRPDGADLRRITDHPAYDGNPAWSADGTKLAFVSNRDGNREIYAIEAAGTGLHRVTSHPGADDDVSWSPDGREVLFQRQISDAASEVWVAGADGSGGRPLTRTLGFNGNPSWSPDGRKIAFFSSRDRNFEIYAMNADGTAQTRLTQGTADNTSPAWSPDGRKIAFQRRLDPTNYEIFVTGADGTGEAQLTVNAILDGPPAWSPDGRRIAFHSKRDGNLEIYAMNADGSGQARLTRSSPADSFGPSWSADGRRIAFVSNRDGNYEIHVMNSDGSGLLRLTNDPEGDISPVWSGPVDE